MVLPPRAFNGYCNLSFALSLTRHELKVLVGLFTGHTTLNRHLTVMKFQQDPLCPACGEQEETSRHFLGECCANMQIRYFTFGVHPMKAAELHKVELSLLPRRGFRDLCLQRDVH